MAGRDLSDVYDAIRAAEAAGDTAAVEKLTEYLSSLPIEAPETTAPVAATPAPANAASPVDVTLPIQTGVLGGATTAIAGKPIGAGVTALTPKAMIPPAAPVVQAPPTGTYHSPYGAGTGAVKNAIHNVDEVLKNKAAQAALNTPGYINPGNSLILQPGVQSPVVTPQAPVAPITTKPKMGMSQLKAAMQAEPNAPHATIPGRIVAGTLAGGYAGDLANQAKQGNVGRAAIDVGGAGSALATLSKHPVVKKAGIAGSIVAPILRYYAEPDKKASGGSIQALAGGKAVKGGLEAVKKLFTPVETKIVRASEALAPHEGKYLNLTQSDRMRSTGGDLGGPGFSKFQLENPEYVGAAWGVGNKPTASGIVNINKRYPEGQAIWAPMIGAEGQHRSNQHVYDALTDEFNRQVSMGKLTPELREAMNKRLSATPKYSHLGLNEIDVANPEHVKNLGNTFDRRAAIAEVLGGEGVGGRKGQIFDYPGVMQEMTDPMTIGSPTHSMGTRLFTLSNEVEHRPDLHSAFPFILKGEDMGVAFNPVPKELAYPSWLNMAKEFTGREPGYMELTRGIKGQGKPHQFIDERYLRALEEAGHAEGGSTTPAWQRKEGKNPEGGLNAVGRASYNRETGGNLKAPQPQGGARRDSFCARMKGMKKKLTSAETANDPDSRINKSLRKWNC